MSFCSPGVACMIEIAEDGKPPLQKKDPEIFYTSQVCTQTTITTTINSAPYSSDNYLSY